MEPVSPALAGRFFTTSATWEALSNIVIAKQMVGSNKINRVNEITYGEEAEDLGLSLEGTEGEKDEGFPGGSVVKHPPANAGDTGSIPGLGRSPGAGNGSPLQYSCLENSMDRGAWQATVHGITKSPTQLGD